MKTDDLKKKSRKGLERLLQKKQEDLRQSRFDLTSSALKNYRAVRETKKDIARILTFLNQKKHG